MNDFASIESQALEALTAHERIAWALERFPKDAILVTSSFGADSAVFLHVLREVDPTLRVGFIDTGFLFEETTAHRDRLTGLLGLDIETYAALSPADPAAEHMARRCGEGPVWCVCRKVEAMQQALQGKACWMTGLRRDQAESRRAVPVLERQARGLVKLHPLADWSEARMRDYLRLHKLPLHPLVGQGYTSIGCKPCTRPAVAGEGARSGRWLGLDRDECGIHTFLRESDPAALAAEFPPGTS